MRRRTGAHWVALAVALLCANQARAQRPWECPEQPIEPCVKRHGRLSSQNGITRTIWIIGTTRRVAVANDFESFPPILQKYLMMTSDDHSSIFGDSRSVYPAPTCLAASCTPASQEGRNSWFNRSGGVSRHFVCCRRGPLTPVSLTIVNNSTVIRTDLPKNLP